MKPPVISATELARELAEANPPVVLHATVVLPKPTSDNDQTAFSGIARFREGHIPGARHADLLDEFADPSASFRFAQLPPQQLSERLAALGVGAGDRVVTYDDDGTIWAARLWASLRAIGFDDVAVLDGGLGAWQAAGGALEAGDVTPAPADEPFVPHPREGFFVDRHLVRELLDAPERAQLVCTLGASSFDGSAISRYARRGHIPSSANLPARGLVGEHGLLLAEPQLRSALQPLLADERPVVLYCGGAISASLVALALHRLGRDDFALYDGSIDEWAADPSLPMETA